MRVALAVAVAMAVGLEVRVSVAVEVADDVWVGEAVRRQTLADGLGGYDE